MRGWCKRRALLALMVLMAVMCFGAQRSGHAEKQAQSDESQTFSEADAQKLMAQIADGLIGQNPDELLSAFDRDRMPDYWSFADRIRQFFYTYQNFRVHYQILGATATESGKGMATADFQLEGDAPSNNTPGVAHSGELQLTCERSKNGWKITNITRGFFQ